MAIEHWVFCIMPFPTIVDLLQLSSGLKMNVPHSVPVLNSVPSCYSCVLYLLLVVNDWIRKQKGLENHSVLNEK